MDTDLTLDSTADFFTTSSPTLNETAPSNDGSQVLFQVPNGTQILEGTQNGTDHLGINTDQILDLQNGGESQVLDTVGLPNIDESEVANLSQQKQEDNLDTVIQTNDTQLDTLIKSESISPIEQQHVTQQSPPAEVTVPFCSGCQQPIRERYLLSAMDALWHEGCLKCSCCGCRLGEVGSSLYTRGNLQLCKRDYLRLFGASGQCAVCRQTIPGFEMVMRIKDNVYHTECFKCQQCRQKFNVGDKLYVCEGRVLCEYDYEEQNLITSIQRGGYSALAQLKKQGASFNKYNNAH